MNYLEKISQLEHDLIKDSELVYGDIFLHAQEIVEYYNERFLNETQLNESYLHGFCFKMFFKKQAKMLILAVLSSVRLHNTQANMDLRQVLELGTLAAYALKHPEEKFYPNLEETQSDDIGKQATRYEKNLKDKVYRWLEANFPDHSSRIKGHKNIINNYTAHGNIMSANSISEFDPETKMMIYSFHDRDHPKDRAITLWLAGNISISFLDIFYKVGVSSEIIPENKATQNKITKFFINDQHIRNELEKIQVGILKDLNIKF